MLYVVLQLLRADADRVTVTAAFGAFETPEEAERRFQSERLIAPAGAHHTIVEVEPPPTE